jgi:hypothetical protein
MRRWVAWGRYLGSNKRLELLALGTVVSAFASGCFEKQDGFVKFEFSWETPQGLEEQGTNAFVSGASFRFGPSFSKGNDIGIVQEQKRLGGDVGDVAFASGAGRGGCVESGHKGIELVAFDAKVNGAARNVAKDGRTIHGFGAELPADRQEGIANGFSFQAADRKMGEENIVGVGRAGGGGLAGGLPGFGDDNEADEAFKGIADKPGSEIIEQFWMGWSCAEAAEVIGGGDQAATEEMMPDAVHDDAGGEGIIRTGEIFSQLEAGTFGGDVRLGIERFQEAAGDTFTWLFVVATSEEGLIGFLGVDETRSADGNGQLRFFIAPGFKKRLKRWKLFQRIAEQTGAKSLVEETGGGGMGLAFAPGGETLAESDGISLGQ